jgi:hypothetical protein
MLELTAGEARAYLERWRLLRDMEAAELRRTSMETKLQQLAALMAARDAFGVEPDREARVQAVRERWETLRRALRD